MSPLPLFIERDLARPICMAKSERAATMFENALVDATDCSGPE